MRQQIGRMREERRRDQVLARRRARIIRARRRERKPVAEMEVAVPDEVVAGARALVLDPRLHARILLAEQSRVAVQQIHVPGNDHGHVGPARRAAGRLFRRADDIGNHVRHAAARILIGRDVPQPFREEPRDVHVERGRPREDLRVAGPPEPLVALRTVGRHVDEVALLAPADVVLQLVHKRLRRLEIPRLRHVGVHDDSGDRFRRERSRIAVDRDVAEPHEREVRLECLRASALQRVADGGLRGAQVLGVEVSVLVEDFRVTQRHRRAGGAVDLQAHPADHVLPEVEDAYLRQACAGS